MQKNLSIAFLAIALSCVTHAPLFASQGSDGSHSGSTDESGEEQKKQTKQKKTAATKASIPAPRLPDVSSAKITDLKGLTRKPKTKTSSQSALTRSTMGSQSAPARSQGKNSTSDTNDSVTPVTTKAKSKAAKTEITSSAESSSTNKKKKSTIVKTASVEEDEADTFSAALDAKEAHTVIQEKDEEELTGLADEENIRGPITAAQMLRNSEDNLDPLNSDLKKYTRTKDKKSYATLDERKNTWKCYTKTRDLINTEIEKLVRLAPKEISLPHAVFSPMILPCLLKLIHDEKEKMYGACYEFDDVRLAQALINARTNEKVVTLIVNGASRKEKGPITFTIDLLLKNNIKVFDSKQRYDDTNLAYSNHRELMHHKFFIFSKSGNTDKPILVTGSYNWTKNACKNNWENAVILDDPIIIVRFLEQWVELKGSSIPVTMTAGI